LQIDRLPGSPLPILGIVTIHVCGSDGQPVGEFEEADFRDKIFANALLPDSYYWHDGMEDWRPISQYRALAKTQRMTFEPPPTRTIKIDMDAANASHQSSKPPGFVARLWSRLRR
jgi:uncharacterized protein DUF4339